MSQMNSELVPLDLTNKVKLAFKLQQFLKKKLKCELILYWISAGGGGLVGGGGNTCFLRMQKDPH